MTVLWLRPTWGEDYSNWEYFFQRTKELGYDGVEFALIAAGPESNYEEIRRWLNELNLKATVITMTSYIGFQGPREVGASVEAHLAEYRINVAAAAKLNPLLIDVQSGSDCWSYEESLNFYRRTEDIDRELGITGKVVHETHRKRCLFHPTNTARLVQALPNLQLTGDISHWTVVGERMLDILKADIEAMEIVIPRMTHLHTRIGTSQISQVSDPMSPKVERERLFFENFWKRVVSHRCQEGRVTTLVPEYGPYPYQSLHATSSHFDLVDSEAIRLRPILARRHVD